MTYSEWEKSVPVDFTCDSVWKSKAYRLALFLSDLAWSDATKLMADKRTLSLADQLYRSVGAISADIEEGNSRRTGRDRARFYEYALGSARESRGWHYKGRHILNPAVAGHRTAVLTEIIKLLPAMVPDQRGNALREEPVEYGFEPSAEPAGHLSNLQTLLDHIPE
jgi:four helix bundle protein